MQHYDQYFGRAEHELTELIEVVEQLQELVAVLRRQVNQEVHNKIDVHVHFDKAISVNVAMQKPPAPGPGAAVKAVLHLKGASMPGKISVDETNETISVEYVDDKGDVTNAPAGASITYSSDNSAVATVDGTSGKVTPVSVGKVNIAAKLAGALEPDGTTTMPDPTPVALEVDPGKPVGARVVASI